METFLIILGIYLINTFLNRWLNITLVKITDDESDFMPFLWFLSLIGLLFFIIALIIEKVQRWNNNSRYSKYSTIDKMFRWFFNPKGKE